MQDASKLPAIVVHPAFIRLAENAPILFRFADKAPNGAPATSPRITCSSCFSLAPFANVETPELAGFSASGGAQTKDVFNWAAFDPYSFRLGTLAQDHKTWSVHTLVRPQTLDQPVLLNWPDTSIPRGGELQFKPLLLGATEFSAELYARPGRAAVDAGRGIVQTKFGNQELDSLELLNLKVPAKDGAALSYPISLHIVGTQLPFAARPNADFKILNSIGNSFKLLDTPTSDFLPLSAVTLSFKDQVLDIQGPVSGCAAIISAANRIDFLSLQTRKIVGSTVTPAGAFYYPGSGALIEYDPGKRTLTRISVPDGRRERSISMPPNVNIAAIGVGTDPGSPITVAVTITQNESVTHFSDLTFTSTEYRNLITVLDGNTLQAAGWSQPVSLARVFNKTAQEVSYGAIPPPQGKPPALPASHSGCIVTLPGSLLVISPTYSIYYPFGNSDTNNLVFGGNLSPGGSISGLMATSGGGDVFKGGSKVPNAPGGESLGLTPCGRYKLVRFFELNQNSMLTVQLAENATPLLIGARFAFFKDDPFMIMPRPILRRVAMLSDEGPLAILSQSGREMQIVDFNIPAMMKVLEPEEFHVVSQPVPCVIEGGTLQYQVKVNNAAAVKNVRLQSPVPGATISSQGLLSFTAPGHITEPTKIHIAIEVEGKNGNAVLHEFPIFVLPRPRTTAKPQVGPI